MDADSLFLEEVQALEISSLIPRILERRGQSLCFALGIPPANQMTGDGSLRPFGILRYHVTSHRLVDPFRHLRKIDRVVGAIRHHNFLDRYRRDGLFGFGVLTSHCSLLFP